jgi:hypothetical protein
MYCEYHNLIGDVRRFETMVLAIALRRAIVTAQGTAVCNEKSSNRGSASAKPWGSSSIMVMPAYPRKGGGTSEVTGEQRRRRPMALSPVKFGRISQHSMTGFTGAILPHDFINMDVSDARVCGVWHSQMKFFAIPWNNHEKVCIRKFKDWTDMNFSINYRELLSFYFSVVLWCTSCRDVYSKDAHIRVVIDNHTVF